MAAALASIAEPKGKAMSELLTTYPVIPVIVIENAEDAEPLAEALLEGGLGIIEVTFRTDAAPEAVARILRACPEMVVGAGTVVTEDQAKRCLDLGVSFGVAPGFNPATVGRFQEHGIPFLPGVASPSEIEAAFACGCSLLKFFPAGASGGPQMVRALAGPYAPLGIRFCPTGGISRDTMNDYLKLPEVFAVGGSWVATKRQIADGAWSDITVQVRDALARAREAGV